MDAHKPTMTVMAARGRESFSAAQLRSLEEVAHLTVVTVPQRLSAAAVSALCCYAEIVGVTRRAVVDFDAGLIDTLPAMRGLAVYARGYDWIDLEALRRRGAVLAVLPDYSTHAVAEHTLGLMLSMSRRLHLSERVVRGDLPSGTSLRGWELRGKTLGVVGLGRIGRAVARLASAFDMRVVSFDDAPSQSYAHAVKVSFQELLAQSDVVVLTCPKQRGTAPLIDAEALAVMKPGAYLINPSRSSLVDSAAVLQATIARHLSGYAVDDSIFDAIELARVEPGRILQTGHTAWYSNEAISRGTQTWTENLVSLARNCPINLV
jgi:lactate dehydrogenase-like 2-hydroxyacid dehydrogenase